MAGWWSMLRGIGFDGVVSLEVLDADRRGGDPRAFARDVHAAANRSCT